MTTSGGHVSAAALYATVEAAPLCVTACLGARRDMRENAAMSTRSIGCETTVRFSVSVCHCETFYPPQTARTAIITLYSIQSYLRDLL